MTTRTEAYLFLCVPSTGTLIFASHIHIVKYSTVLSHFAGHPSKGLLSPLLHLYLHYNNYFDPLQNLLIYPLPSLCHQQLYKFNNGTNVHTPMHVAPTVVPLRPYFYLNDIRTLNGWIISSIVPNVQGALFVDANCPSINLRDEIVLLFYKFY